jgi:hypothetical protein
LSPNGTASPRRKLLPPPAEWNVTKVEKSSVSLLLYEPFDVDFPALLVIVKQDLTAIGKLSRRTCAMNGRPVPLLRRPELKTVALARRRC